MKNIVDFIVLQLSVNIKLETVLLRRTGKWRGNIPFPRTGSDTMMQLVKAIQFHFCVFLTQGLHDSSVSFVSIVYTKDSTTSRWQQ